jgi:hypothetical protein
MSLYIHCVNWASWLQNTPTLHTEGSPVINNSFNPATKDGITFTLDNTGVLYVDNPPACFGGHDGYDIEAGIYTGLYTGNYNGSGCWLEITVKGDVTAALDDPCADPTGLGIPYLQLGVYLPGWHGGQNIWGQTYITTGSFGGTYQFELPDTNGILTAVFITLSNKLNVYMGEPYFAYGASYRLKASVNITDAPAPP